MARRKSAIDVLHQRNRLLGQIKRKGENMPNGEKRSALANRFRRVDRASKKYVKNMTGRTVLNSFVLDREAGNRKYSRRQYMGLANG